MLAESGRMVFVAGQRCGAEAGAVDDYRCGVGGLGPASARDVFRFRSRPAPVSLSGRQGIAAYRSSASWRDTRL